MVLGCMEGGVNGHMRDKPDAAFVCTPPGSHADIILPLISEGIPVFTELNLTDEKYGEILSVSRQSGAAVFMSGTMLYDKRVQQIKKATKSTDKPLTYLYHVGQYLPDWHPWEDYTGFFAGKKETNGVREILAVQLPWLIDTFGEVVDTSSIGHRCTGLAIDFDDSVSVTLKHQNGTVGMFLADIVSRKAVTRLEVIGEDLYLSWDGSHDGIYFYDALKKQEVTMRAYGEMEHMDGYSNQIIENRYEDEVRDFLGMIRHGEPEPKYSLEKDMDTIAVINQILSNL